MTIQAMDDKNFATVDYSEMPSLKGVCQVLEEAGVEYLFGLPGGNISKMYNYLHDYPSIQPILVRHEQVASIMAEVYGRITRKPGIYASQGAWATTNGTMGAIEALLGSSPMIMLTDFSDNGSYSHLAPYQVGTGEYGGFDLRKSLEAVTKYTTAVYTPRQAIQSTQLAFKHSMSGNPGPVGVIYHTQAIKETIGSGQEVYHTKNYLAKNFPEVSATQIKELAQLLINSRLPVIISGSGVNHASANEEMRWLSEKLSIPIVTTAGGKSSIEETHINAAGVFGNWGQDAANELLNEADLILVIGTRLTPTDTLFADKKLINPYKQTIIQIDLESLHTAWTFPINHSIIGDAKEVIHALNSYLKNNTDISVDVLNSRRKWIDDAKNNNDYMETAEGDLDTQPIFPQRVIKELEKSDEGNTIYTLDSGENRVLMTHYYKTKSAKSIVAPTSSGAMGYSIPAALAVKLVHPEKEVIALCGDGGFPMTMNALLTALQYELPITVVVLNNSSLGWVKNNQNNNPIASEFIDTDFSKIAIGMGCEGYRVTDPADIASALKKAKESKKPVVIDVVITDQVSYHKAYSSMMRDKANT